MAGAAVAGLVWGAVMRAWMRFVSTDPEFTWSGTGFILAAATLAGFGLGAAWTLRAGGGRTAWRFAAIPLILLGAGAGSIMLPTALAGGWALARRRARPTIRLPVALAGLAFQIPVAGDLVADLGPVHAGAGLAWYAVMLAIEAVGFSIVFLPGAAPAGVQLPTRSTAVPKRRSRPW